MIKKYLIHRKWIFILSLIIGFSYYSVMSLSDIPSYLLIYAAEIHLALLLIFSFFDFFAFSAKMKKLETIRKHLSSEMHEYPQALNPSEELYTEIIADLHALLKEELNRSQADKNEQIDYYTMWLHQIKTPISAIQLALESPSEDREMLSRELFKIRQYVEMALQYARMRDISSDLVVKEYRLDDIVSGCIKKHSDLFIHKGLYADFEKSAVIVTTDEKWLSFIIEQFLSNAVKYTSRGGVKIYFREHTLYIEDTGLGIRPEDIPRIFERGYTGNNGRLDKKASGLGLFMAGRVAGVLGLNLSVTSEEMKGTRAAIDFGKLTKM